LENFDDPNRDLWEEAAALRRELSEGDPPTPEPQMDWLDRLDQLHRALNENVIRSACIDNSPTLIFDHAATNVINGMTAADNLGDVGLKVVAEGFDAIHDMLAREEVIAQERIKILQEMTCSLLTHRCDYKADLEVDDFDPETGMDRQVSNFGAATRSA
jgi:hypothetical protein